MEPIAAAIGWSWGDTLDKWPVYRDPFKQDIFSSFYYSSWCNFIVIYYCITWVYVQTRSKAPNPHPPQSSCTNSLSVSVRLSILEELHHSLLYRFSGLRSDVEWRVADLPHFLPPLYHCLAMTLILTSPTVNPFTLASSRGKYLIWWKVSFSCLSCTCRQTTEVENIREAATERCSRALSSCTIKGLEERNYWFQCPFHLRRPERRGWHLGRIRSTRTF